MAQFQIWIGIASLVIGGLLAIRWTVFILIPCVPTGIALAFGAAWIFHQDHVAAMIVAAVSMQLGYLLGTARMTDVPELTYRVCVASLIAMAIVGLGLRSLPDVIAAHTVALQDAATALIIPFVALSVISYLWWQLRS